MPHSKRRPHWYETHAAVTAAIPTGHDDERHRVTWRRGRLVLHDHDVAAEEVLTALGGERCECLYLLEALQGKSDDAALGRGAGPRRLRRGAYGAGAALPGQPGPSPAQLRAAILQTQYTSPQQHQALIRRLRGQGSVPEELTEIFRAANALRSQRRAASRMPNTPPTGSNGPARPIPAQALEAAVVPALERSIRESHPHLRTDAPISIGCWREVPGEPAVFQGALTRRGGFIAVSLPLRWLVRVWCRGMAVIDTHFVLDVDAPAPATELRGHVIEWQQQFGGHSIPVARSCHIVRRDRVWHLSA